MTPGKGGQTVDFDGTSVPVFGSVGEAMEATGADVTVIFVPAKFTKGAVVEAIDAEIPLAVVITEGVPVHDTAEFFTLSQGSNDPAHRPELPRAHLARAVQRGHHPRRHHPGRPHRPGQQVGHADLPDDVRAARHRLLHRASASAATRSSGPPTSTRSQAFQDDPDTDAIVMIGEIGGDAEERAAEYIKANVTKPVVGYVAGLHRAGGQDHGPRRRDRVRLRRHRGGQEGGPRGRRRPGRQDPERDRPDHARGHALALSPRPRVTDERVGMAHRRGAGSPPLSFAGAVGIRLRVGG